MAKDVFMKKGTTVIKVVEDFVPNYEKNGWSLNEENKKISVEKETQKVIKDLKKTKE
tara:strand:+ start:41 stop:211 length:171 start_codon:yes stop_codon:yes gene_type:complete